MVAYAIFVGTVQDHDAYQVYRDKVMPTIDAYGGRFITRGANLRVIEGEWNLPAPVILEFPSRSAAEAWYDSAEYREILDIRLNSGSGVFVLVDGV
ncbi:DUF1330 domain-containing protein [Burkholderia cepacia]|uniref:DUF1330 domain-containing protein n=1 Tax=Burkholderia cepacia GG4 TaxID=1009846 RepID=A0A9W3PC05_BURCE|nr:DUF1330 domain-containing protein [Burkholderia cepacia]AFQ51081.1 hypothetical protein GEM_4691 [Burkholderia cepacia GG4]